MSGAPARRGSRAGALLIGLSLVASGTRLPAEPAPRTVSATPAQLLDLADALIRRGSREGAERILLLLSSDPRPDVRNEARFRRARLLAAEGRRSAAAVLLRQILDEKPGAAPARLELARTLQLLGDTNGALRQLRAVQSAGLPPSVARIIDRYSAALRAQRPYGASLEIAIAPDSNINRATRSDTLGTVFGDFQIADEGKAKSGTGLSLNGQVFRRLSIGGEASLVFRASGFANLYRRGRFNDIAADLAAGPEFSFGRDRLQLEIGTTQRWFGQKP